MEKLLVTQALDERDLLVKKINDKISKASFVDTIKNNEDNTRQTRISEDNFSVDARASLQQIEDLIKRYQKIDAAIVASNAQNTIDTSYGTFTVAGAISLRNRIRGGWSDETSFESRLARKMKSQLDDATLSCQNANARLEQTAENMRLSILGKDSRTKEDKPLDVVDTYVKQNTSVVVDPLDVEKQITEITEKHSTLLRELDTKIKVSNATCYIEI